ncbi:hypothetical protein ACHAXT_003837 [Thalassiosira profunda]
MSRNLRPLGPLALLLTSSAIAAPRPPTATFFCPAPAFVRYSPHAVKIKTMPDAPACAPGGKCVPCESLDKSHLLTHEQLDAELATMPLWEAKDDDGTKKITRSYTARSFQKAVDSVVAIGHIAERENHHPDLHITSYRNVEIVIYTHSIGGISANDIALAKMIDREVEIDYSPKWLKSHPEAAK